MYKALTVAVLLGLARADNPRRFILSGSASGHGSTDCFYSSSHYRGSYSTTISGRLCLDWETVLDSHDPLIKALPDSARSAGNKCRDPDGSGHPWCFISVTKQRDFCDVPYCPECYYQSSASSRYNGFVTVNDRGEHCDFWANTTTHIPTADDNFPLDGTIVAANNYCRDPYGFGVPGCYSNGVYRSCNISRCTSDCQDDPNTNCVLVKHYICQDEYSRQTLCPKTCNSCNFGLLPPRHVSPPMVMCEDTPDANCDVLQDYICADPESARKFCPKTCRICDSFMYINTTQTSTTTASTQTQVTSTTQVMTSLSTTSALLPHWSEWGAYECKMGGDVCFQVRIRNCSTGFDLDCNGAHSNIELCTANVCPMMTQPPHWSEWGDPSPCSLKSGACLKWRNRNCSTAHNADCDGSPISIEVCTMDMCHTATQTSPTQNTKVISTSPSPHWLEWSASQCVSMGHGCYQSRVRNCSTAGGCVGKDYSLTACTTDTCLGSDSSTSTIMTTVVTSPTALSAHWSEWSAYHCEIKSGVCLQARYRNCSTGNPSHCPGNDYRVDLCTAKSCPELYAHATTTVDPCVDQTNWDCDSTDIKDLICYDSDLATTFCPKSCQLCGPNACTDYLNCTSDVQAAVCSDDSLSVAYCRRSCRKCDVQPIPVTINSCGDPVHSPSTCQLLQAEIQICQDPVLVVLCKNYCTTGCNATAPADSALSKRVVSDMERLARLLQ